MGDKVRRRYNYDRFRRGRLMAEGIAVHATSPEEALGKATRLLHQDADDRREGVTITFRDNSRCAALSRCSICLPAPCTETTDD